MVAILMTPVELAITGLLKFWNKGYDLIIYVQDVNNKFFVTWFQLHCRCGYVTKVW